MSTSLITALYSVFRRLSLLFQKKRTPAIASEKVALEYLGEEMILLHRQTGFYYLLNRTAAKIWESLATDQVPSGLVSELRHPSAEKQEAVDRFIEELVQNQLVETPPETARARLASSLEGPSRFELPTIQKYGDFRHLIPKRRKLSVAVKEEWRTLKGRWPDDRDELLFRVGRAVWLRSRPIGGSITGFSADDMTGFHSPEREFGSPFRWSEASASMEFWLQPGPHFLRLAFRPFRDLTRLFEDGLSLRWNDHLVPTSSFRWEDRFLVCPLPAADFEAGMPQLLSWSIQPWPSPGDPRELGLPLSHVWLFRDSRSSS